MNQSWMFLSRFIRSPRSVGSVLPSSRFLVNAMLANIDWRHLASVAELGAGTGVMTEAIQNRRDKKSAFICFESDNVMRAALEQRYESLDSHDNAFELRAAIRSRGLTGLDCVVSSLPFTNFSHEDRNYLLAEIHELLNPGGLFVAFQYTRQLQPCLVSIFGEMDTVYIWANMPPAFVYFYRRGR